MPSNNNMPASGMLNCGKVAAITGGASGIGAGTVRRFVEEGLRALLSGERREVTVLMSDLAGFSAIAERLEPESVVEGTRVGPTRASGLGRVVTAGEGDPGQTAAGEERFLGIDEGVLVKRDREVRVSVIDAFASADLTSLQSAIQQQVPDLDVYITDVVNVLEYEDLTQVTLIGHSYGGRIITGVAEQVPDLLQRGVRRRQDQVGVVEGFVRQPGALGADAVEQRREALGEGDLVTALDSLLDRLVEPVELHQVLLGHVPLALGENAHDHACPSSF